MYTSNEKGKICFLLIYVDDILIGSENDDKLNEVINALKKEYGIHVLGVPKKFLGMQIEYSSDNTEIFINQKEVISSIAKEFNVTIDHHVLSPMQNKLKLNPAKFGNKTKQFQKLLGKLMYVMLCSRPDICFCITFFSQFQKSADDEHFGYLLNVLKYLHSTKDLKLSFGMFSNQNLGGFADADFANTYNSKSISGYCFKNFGNLIVWRSCKQSVVALSTTEAEILPLCIAICEALHLKKVLIDFGLNISNPIVLNEDNEPAIKIMRNYRNNARCKHIMLRVDFILDWLEKGIIEIKYIPSKMQLADVFTKSFPAVVFKNFVGCLCLK